MEYRRSVSDSDTEMGGKQVMFIVSTDKKSMVNMDAVAAIYIGSNEVTIKVDYKGGDGCQMNYHV